MSGRYGWAAGCVVPIAVLVGLGAGFGVFCVTTGIEELIRDPAPLINTIWGYREVAFLAGAGILVLVGISVVGLFGRSAGNKSGPADGRDERPPQ